MSDPGWATRPNMGIKDPLKIPCSPDESGRGMRSLSRFDRAIMALRSVL